LSTAQGNHLTGKLAQKKEDAKEAADKASKALHNKALGGGSSTEDLNAPR